MPRLPDCTECFQEVAANLTDCTYLFHAGRVATRYYSQHNPLPALSQSSQSARLTDALEVAALGGDLDLCTRLLCQAHCLTPAGLNCVLFHAVQGGNVDICSRLHRMGARPDTWQMLYLAAVAGNDRMCSWLLSVGNASVGTLLLILRVAAQECQMAVFKLMLVEFRSVTQNESPLLVRTWLSEVKNPQFHRMLEQA